MKKIVLLLFVICIIPPLYGQCDKMHPTSLEEDSFNNDDFDDIADAEVKRNYISEPSIRKVGYVQVIARRIGIMLLMKYTAFITYIKTKYIAWSKNIRL